MGDFHFVVRHGLTGVVLLLFVIAGVFIANYDLAVTAPLTRRDSMKELSNLVPLLVSAPIIGITVQGIYMVLVQVFGGGIFKDRARMLVLERLQRVLGRPDLMLGRPDLVGMSPDEAREFCADVLSRCQNCPDALFVWLYHTSAHPQLVEWARRRRSYHYLGFNWAIGGVLGLLTGVAAGLWNGPVRWNEGVFWRLIAVAASVSWIGGSYYLGRMMKRDVDSMELMWTFGHLHPKLRDLPYGEDESRSLRTT